MMNKVFLVGRITKDPELRNSSNGTPYCFFTIAINRLPNQNGERQTDFIPCVAWRAQAENLARFIRKGGLIGVDGSIQVRNQTGTDGVNRQVVEVLCSNITFLESKQRQDDGYQNQPAYNDIYEQNQNGRYQQNQNNYQNQNYMNNSYNQNSYNGYQQNRQAGNTPRANENQVNQFSSSYNSYNAEKDKQQKSDSINTNFDISDDDLPF